MSEKRKDVIDGLTVFNNSFKSANMSEKEFINKHLCNPFSIQNPIRLYYEDGMPAGMNAFMGMYIMDNIHNVSHYVAQSNDSAVLPQHRGKHIFTKIVSDFEENDFECEYCIGIPNDNSYMGFLKMGWKKVAELRTLTMKRNKLSLLYQPKAIDNLIIKEKELEYKVRSDYELSEAELTEVNKSSEVMTPRTKQYVEWKLSNKSGHVLYCYECESLVGYIVFHVSRREKYRIGYNQITIDDWYYISQPALKNMIDKIAKIGYVICIPLVNISNPEYKDFIKCGFADISKSNSAFLMTSPRGLEHDYLSKYSFRGLDGDYILNS